MQDCYWMPKKIVTVQYTLVSINPLCWILTFWGVKRRQHKILITVGKKFWPWCALSPHCPYWEGDFELLETAAPSPPAEVDPTVALDLSPCPSRQGPVRGDCAVCACPESMVNHSPPVEVDPAVTLDLSPVRPDRDRWGVTALYEHAQSQW